MKEMVDVVAAHDGTFKPFSQSTIMNRVPREFREGVCSGASAIFLYLNALRHSRADDDSLYRYMTTLDDYLSQTETYVEQGMNLTVKRWVESFDNTPEDELRERLELFKSAQFKLNYRDLQPRPKKQPPSLKDNSAAEEDHLGMHLKPTAAERKKIAKYNKSDSSRTEILSFRSYIQFRSINRIVELQRIMKERDSFPRGPFEDHNIRVHEEQLSILCGRTVKRIDGDGDGFLLFNKDSIARLFKNNGCFMIGTPMHAHAAYLNDAVSPGKFKYFEPNFGIASFPDRTRFTDFMAEWLLTSKRYEGHIDIDRFSL
jgi:hypothetical protein